MQPTSTAATCTHAREKNFKMNQTFHHPPEGQQFLIGHGSADCRCKPRRTTEQKSRGGQTRQGYLTIVHFWHNPLTPDTNTQENS